MARTTLEHQENRLTFPPDSLLLLQIEEAEVRERTGRTGNKWEVVNVKFGIRQVLAIGGAQGDPQAACQPYQNWVGQSIYGSVRFYLSDKDDNPLRNWIEAILEVDQLPLGFEFDTNMIVGRTCKGVTSTYQGSATDPNGVPYTKHEIKHLLKAGGMAMGNPQQNYQQPPQQGWGQPAPQGFQPQVQQQYQQQPQTAQDPWATPGVSPQPVQQQAYPPQAQPQAQQQGLWQQGQQQAYPPQAQPQVQQGQPVQQPAPPVEDPWAGYVDEPGF